METFRAIIDFLNTLGIIGFLGTWTVYLLFLGGKKYIEKRFESLTTHSLLYIILFST